MIFCNIFFFIIKDLITSISSFYAHTRIRLQVYAITLSQNRPQQCFDYEHEGEQRKE